LGRLTVEQAAVQPRRNELRQAIGCRPEVKPEIAVAALVPGDWLVVCTDGLTGCLPPAAIQAELEQSASAESAARRLVNRANQLGATDNVSVAVVRATSFPVPTRRRGCALRSLPSAPCLNER